MDIHTMNVNLSQGEIDKPQVFPHIERLQKAAYQFTVDFGLPHLPEESGILMIRGARQYGKSTWLEQQVYNTVKQFGAGTAYYLNGDYIPDIDALTRSIEDLIFAFSVDAPVKRLFIDEITAISNWEVALKRLADRGQLENVLVVTTGSKATDLRRGAERLPGRKGKLSRTTYLFTPVSYGEFKRQCGEHLGDKTLISYLLSGGSPIACAELATTGVIPEYVVELVRDWVEGEITGTGRARSTLLNIMKVLYRFGGSPVGQAKLAREAGLANNTVAANYIEILRDLGSVIPSYPWDQNKGNLILRKECKYHFNNLLVAVCYHPGQIRRVDDFMALSNQEQGMWTEWLVAQELCRRMAIQGTDMLAPLGFWQNKHHEIDFILSDEQFLEVKRGPCSALEFSWFGQQFPNKKLTVVSASSFATSSIQGIDLENFLL